MIKQIVTVLLIEDNPEYAALVQRWLSPKEDIEFVLNWTNSLAAGLNRLENGDIDAILLDLGLPDSHGLKTFTTTKMYASGIPILILSGSEAESIALQEIQQGAEDFYITKSACDGTLLVKALRHAVGRFRQRVSEVVASDQGAVIGVMGAKGGVGVTTFACNLALELRRQADQRVLVADLDVNAGLVSFLMKTGAEHSILDAVANIHRLNHSFWNGIVAHGPGGVDIMPSPNLLGVDSADIHKIHDVLALIRSFYRWTVLDLGRLASLSLSLLDQVNELYLVTAVNIPAVREAKRTIGVLTRAGLEPNRLRLIVNHVGTEELSGSELAGLFGVPVYAKLPGVARELDDAYASGQLLGANSDYRARIANLARKMTNPHKETSGGPVAESDLFAGKFHSNHKGRRESDARLTATTNSI
jgi:Flp pilus assembly CpaE family ATPase